MLPIYSETDPISEIGALRRIEAATRAMAGGDTPTSVVAVTLQTAAAGATFAVFGAQPCTDLDIVNSSGTPVEYRRGGAGVAIQIAAGGSRLVRGITDAAQIGVRRVDQSNTQVAVTAEAFTFAGL